MTDDLQRDSTREDPDETDRGVDAPLEPDGTADKPEEPNPWLKEGADAPDAADIEDPDEQR